MTQLSTLIAAAHTTLPYAADQEALVQAGTQPTFDAAVAWLLEQAYIHPSPTCRRAAERAKAALVSAYWDVRRGG